MPVSTKHPSYQDAAEQWKTNRDACAGQKAIKDGKTRYLPGFQPEDIERYRAYVKRARFLNVTGRTKEALTGAVFRREPQSDLPTLLEYLNEDADGSGESLTQLAKRTVEEELQTARYGLLVDYPSAPEGLTEEQVQAFDLKAHIHPYRAESIINWDTKAIAGKKVLSLVVLSENVSEPVDMFESQPKVQYRVLALDESLNYYQQIYDERDQPVGNPAYPRDRDGKLFSEIPFVFIGAEDNKPDIDKAPLTDLADTNISHYQVSADHMENLHIHGQLTLGIASRMDWQQFKEANPNGVMVGARAGHFLGEGGSFTTATAPESSSLSKALDDLKADMIAIGGRIIQPKTGQRTAEEARIDSASEMSILETLVGNVSEGIEKAAEFCARFMGADPEDVEFKLNREFFDKMPDAQMLMTMMGLEDRGHMAQSDIRDYLRAVGVLKPERTDEDIDEDVGQDGGIPNAGETIV